MANQEHSAILERGVEAWNAWRKQIGGGQPDLSGIDLQGRDLDNIHFFQTDLSGADLSGCRMERAELRSANLGGANLSKVNLFRANLTSTVLAGANLGEGTLAHCLLLETDLSGASLKGASLVKSTLVRAKVFGTDFTDAIFALTGMVAIDFSEAVGLERVEHRAGSDLGVDSLLRSRGLVPDVFLRGCGIPENVVRYLNKFLRPEAIEFYSCFISYGHADDVFARRLHDRLEASEVRCWLDEHQMLPGDDFYETIDQGIHRWDKVLLCCSAASLTSPWVDREIDKGLQKEEQLGKARGEAVRVIVPLNLDGYLFKWKSGKASILKSRLAADFTGWESDDTKFEQSFQKVVLALRADEGGREPPPAPRL